MTNNNTLKGNTMTKVNSVYSTRNGGYSAHIYKVAAGYKVDITRNKKHMYTIARANQIATMQSVSYPFVPHCPLRKGVIMINLSRVLYGVTLLISTFIPAALVLIVSALATILLTN